MDLNLESEEEIQDDYKEKKKYKKRKQVIKEENKEVKVTQPKERHVRDKKKKEIT